MKGGEKSHHSESAPNILILTLPNFPLLNIHATSITGHSPRRSGAETPPLQTLASVPFRWEEQPGKPRAETTLKCLELPPSSPTAVLDGPYDVGRPKFSSLRYFRDSFDDSTSPADDAGDKCITRQNAKGLFGRSLRWKVGGRKEDGTSGFSHSSETKKVLKSEANTSRNAKSTRLWASIYKGLKQVVIPWKSAAKKSKKDYPL